MKVSYRWLNEYLPIEETPEQLAEILTGLGLEVAGVEAVDSIPGGLEGIVIGQVLTSEDHPNADRLKLTTVDIGKDQPLSIVCGAPNVEAGQKVLVAPPGTTIHPISGESFTIDVRKVRGEKSEGMICAEDELSLGTDHSGIVVLPDDAQVGGLAAEFYAVERDYVFDIDLTPNRSDATSHLGVAADLAAYYKIHKGYNGDLRRPDVSAFKPNKTDKGVEVEVMNSEACPRYAGVTISGIKVGPSPRWLQHRLQAIDVRPINNIVDITNFVLHEMGQPLHAFDVGSISGRKIIVRTLGDDADFVTLDEVERKLRDNDLMICDGTSRGLCIAGVFGGIGSGVTDKTTEVFIESAHFNPTWVRRTSMHHNLRTDAAKCFEKTTDPSICVEALKRAALMITEIAGGVIASEIIDIYPDPIRPAEVNLRRRQVERLLGIEIDEQEFRNILDALHFDILSESNGAVKIAIPTNKADVQREADVIEEFLRIYGINRIPLKTKMHTTFALADRPTQYEFRRFVGNHLASLGFHEAMGLSITESALTGDLPADELHEGNTVGILNTSNVSLDILRPNLLVSALEAVRYNQSRQQMAVRIFEFGKSYAKKEEGYEEEEHLTLTLTDRTLEDNWLSGDEPENTYYTLKKYVHAVLEKLGIRANEVDHPHSPFAYGQEYELNDSVLVRFGEIEQIWLEAFDIKTKVYYADFAFKKLYRHFRQQKITTTEVSRYPAVFRDLAIVIPESVQYVNLVDAVNDVLGGTVVATELFDVYRNEEQLGKGNKSYALRFRFEDPSRTLRDEDVDAMMQKLVRQMEIRYSARLR